MGSVRVECPLKHPIAEVEATFALNLAVHGCAVQDTWGCANPLAFTIRMPSCLISA